MKKLMSLIVSLVLLMGVPVFAADQDIVEIASGNSDFSILVAALQKADLVGALQGEGPFTVFAPTNAAFEKLLQSLNISADDLLGHPQLKDVLLYHVVSGQVLSTDLSNGMSAPTLGGENITVDLSSGVKINNASVTTADVMATNGVIHIIDTVLVPNSFKLAPEPAVPATVVDIALSSNDFSILVAALQKADLVGALQGEGPFTVFAPTNAAFEKLLAALNISASDLLNQPDLAKVLLYHVVSGNVKSTDLSDGLMADTLNGEKVEFDLSSGVKVNSSQVISADIAAGNGVVHVIDTVLVPENFVYQNVTANAEMPKTSGISLTPYFLIGIMTLAGAGFMKKRHQG
jgi:transforming growth factor-beta-induced protein